MPYEQIGFDDPTVHSPKQPKFDRDPYEGLKAANLPRDAAILLIDASGLAYRAFHTRDYLEGYDGSKTGVLHGMLQMTRSVCAAANTRKWCYVWDGSIAARRKVYPAYKSRHDRARTPEEVAQHDDFRQQLKLAKEVLAALAAPSLIVPEVEADDLIGLCVGEVSDPLSPIYGNAIVVSDDRDMYQLLGRRCAVWRGSRGKLVTEADFRSEHGFGPELYDSYKGLVGESATGDNIPGVPGIGDVKAASLVGQYGDLDAIIVACEKLCQGKKPLKIHLAVRQHAAAAKLSRRLSKITRDTSDLASWGYPESVVKRIMRTVREAVAYGGMTNRPCPRYAVDDLRGRLGFVSSFDVKAWESVCGFNVVKGDR